MQGSVFLFALGSVLLPTTLWAADPEKLSGIGDSISQGWGANNFPGEHPEFGFGQGTDTKVNSVYLRFKAKFSGMTKEFVSESGAEMVGGRNNAAGQAARICAMAKKPNRVILELGGNDVCSRDKGSSSDATSKLYSVTTYRNALKSALDVLAGCLPAGSQVQVLSMPRVDYLYEAGNAKNFITCNLVWSIAGVCRVVTGEGNASRRAAIGARVDQYNDGLRAEVEAAASRNAGKINFFTDWRGTATANSSVGTYRFSKDDIDGLDCFHPAKDTGQRKLACAAWEAGEYGSLSNVPSCLK
ncbi:MAG TPA: SGNH/GDSL hydrolase family protein [Pseudomonadota bacterium]|nr:SGNH/GDSL hydrolase family protein [Pseudomonadota bacterium]